VTADFRPAVLRLREQEAELVMEITVSVHSSHWMKLFAATRSKRKFNNSLSFDVKRALLPSAAVGFRPAARKALE
jgi:hypothetical protein